jgi:hypothetical protein
MLNVVSQKFFEKVKTIAAAKLELKSPFSPPFSKGEFPSGILTPLWKRGAGEIFEWNKARDIERTSGTEH